MEQKTESVIIKFRASPEVKAKIQQDASACNKTVSEYLRDLAMGQKVVAQKPPKPIEFWTPPQRLQEVSDELRKIYWEMIRTGKIDRKIKKMLLEEGQKVEETRCEFYHKYLTDD